LRLAGENLTCTVETNCLPRIRHRAEEIFRQSLNRKAAFQISLIFKDFGLCGESNKCTIKG